MWTDKNQERVTALYEKCIFPPSSVLEQFCPLNELIPERQTDRQTDRYNVQLHSRKKLHISYPIFLKQFCPLNELITDRHTDRQEECIATFYEKIAYFLPRLLFDIGVVLSPPLMKVLSPSLQIKIWVLISNNLKRFSRQQKLNNTIIPRCFFLSRS